MCDLEVRKKIAKKFENSLLFDYPNYDNSIIGITKDGNVVYDYEIVFKEK